MIVFCAVSVLLFTVVLYVCTVCTIDCTVNYLYKLCCVYVPTYLSLLKWMLYCTYTYKRSTCIYVYKIYMYIHIPRYHGNHPDVCCVVLHTYMYISYILMHAVRSCLCYTL